MKKILRPKTIIFTGFEHKKKYVETAQERGFHAVLLTCKIKPSYEGIFDDIFEVNFYKRKEVDAIIPVLKERFNTKAIISNYEKFVVPRSYIAEKLGVVSTSVYGACCSRNKILQRYALSVMPENIPWKRVKTLKGLEKAFKSFENGAFLKYISGIKSRCIYHIQDKEELSRTWGDFCDTLKVLNGDFQEDYKYLDFRFDYPNPQKHFLLEKAIYGQQVTVSSFSGSHNILNMPSMCDIYTARDIGRDDSFLAFRILPSKHSDFLVQEAHKITETATQILGLRYCGIFADLIITPENEIKIIEIASRIGGYRDRMYEEVYNISLSKQLINVAIGKKISISRKAKKHVSLVELFAESKGEYAKILDPENYLVSEGVIDVQVKVQKKDIVGLAREGFGPVACITIAGETYQEVYEKSLLISQECKVCISGD